MLEVQTAEPLLPYTLRAMSPPTPVLTFGLRVAGVERRLHLKAEWCSVFGSSKGRTAASLMASVLDRVDPQSGIIESTSGNLGLALAELCAQAGIPFTAVVDPRTNSVLVTRMRAVGASIVESTTEDGHGGYLLSRLKVVQEALRRDPRLVWTNQYGNPANPAAHCAGTAPELAAQVNTAQQVFVPVSTGGTLAGFRWHADANSPGWRCVGVDMVGSAALGGVAGERMLPGIGASRRSTFLPHAGVDAEYVSPAEAVAACEWAGEALGVGIGGSAGAAVAAAVRRMQRCRWLIEVACICPDGAQPYRETIFSPAWRAEHRLWPTAFGAEVIEGRAA